MTDPGAGSETAITSAEAWARLTEGNVRFAAGTAVHPRQDPARRAELTGGQWPIAAVFGCSDSRASEQVFDQGLGDLFVIRTAGQVVAEPVLGSIEYAVGVLNVPLLVVLAHESCGAVRAAIARTAPDAEPLPPLIAALIDPIDPAVRQVAVHTGIAPHEADTAAVGQEHLRRSLAAVLERSEIVAGAVAAGTLAVVGATYELATGRVLPLAIVGDIA